MINAAKPSTFTATASAVPQQRLHQAAHAPSLRAILLVEPDITLLSAEVLLLTRSDYSVTSAFSEREIFALRETKAIALAILSDYLGPRLLAVAAQTVRKQWPLARILILTRPEFVLEDHLYDEQIEQSSEPKQLLEAVERLYKESWNQHSNTIDWDVKRTIALAACSRICDSDPTKDSPA